MLILILIDIQYTQNVVFSFEKGSNGQNHSSSVYYHLIKNIPQQNFSFPPVGGFPPTLFGKTWKQMLLNVMISSGCANKFFSE